ncbi:hypothetical protein HPULCUR_000372 [Helicostylum pulchrum]|uniref:Exosome complex protein n=1 Tax=Helicostylum pulchrum TaxID=562976 RepID=A0ABP9XJR0_9FUNG
MDTVNQEIPKKAVRALRSRLHVVKKHLEPIFAKPLSEIYTKLPIAERYELEVLLSYSLNTLYYIYLRTQGSDPNQHDVMKELVRVQAYIKKLKRVQGKEDKPTMKVDTDAAARFIKAAIKEDKETAENEAAVKKRKLEEEVSDSSSSEDEAPPKPTKKSKRN